MTDYCTSGGSHLMGDSHSMGGSHLMTDYHSMGGSHPPTDYRKLSYRASIKSQNETESSIL